MAMSAEHRSKFAALHWSLWVSIKFSNVKINHPKQQHILQRILGMRVRKFQIEILILDYKRKFYFIAFVEHVIMLQLCSISLRLPIVLVIRRVHGPRQKLSKIYGLKKCPLCPPNLGNPSHQKMVYIHVTQDKTPPFRKNWKAPYSITFQSPFSRLNGRYISVTIQWPFSVIQSPFRRLSVIFVLLFP